MSEVEVLISFYTEIIKEVFCSSVFDRVIKFILFIFHDSNLGKLIILFIETDSYNVLI